MTTRRACLRHFFGATFASKVSLPAEVPLIADIRRTVLWRGRESEKTWFHPRACLIPERSRPLLLMTLQEITGSDVFHHVHCSESRDLGATWSAPQPIPGMGWRDTPDGLLEGICDVVPEYHPNTRTVIAMGHNVYYDRSERLARPSEKRWPVYIVRDPSGRWGPVKRLSWEEPQASAMYTSNCSQRVTLPDGDILVPLSFGALNRPHRSVCTARCSFNGSELTIRATGNSLSNAVGRGLLEPSLALHNGRYFMTIRAEDDRGYVSVSDNGLDWAAKKPWCWEDGEPLTMSTTQQRWLPHSDGPHLTYTRKDRTNANVFRWRVPIFVAKVDTKRLCLLRDTERIVFPLEGDGVNHPVLVPYLGNFHTTAINQWQSLVTTCETMPKTYRGNTLQARIIWSRPNRSFGRRVS